MNMYRVLRDHPQTLKALMQQHQGMHSEDYYYLVKSQAPDDSIVRAARFLYLNRACWNGLYRVNTHGKFNVPKGTKTRVFFESDDYEGASRLLRNLKLRSTDFETIIDEAQPGAFVFVDPPYTVKHNSNGFARYNEEIFWVGGSRAIGAMCRAGLRPWMQDRHNQCRSRVDTGALCLCTLHVSISRQRPRGGSSQACEDNGSPLHLQLLDSGWPTPIMARWRPRIWTRGCEVRAAQELASALSRMAKDAAANMKNKLRRMLYLDAASSSAGRDVHHHDPIVIEPAWNSRLPRMRLWAFCWKRRGSDGSAGLPLAVC